MAIDTAAKQSSILNAVCGLSFNLLPIPDGAYDEGDKQHLLGLYRGIAFSSAGLSLEHEAPGWLMPLPRREVVAY